MTVTKREIIASWGIGSGYMDDECCKDMLESGVPSSLSVYYDDEKVGTCRNLEFIGDERRGNLWGTLTIRKEYSNCAPFILEGDQGWEIGLI